MNIKFKHLNLLFTGHWKEKLLNSVVNLNSWMLRSAIKPSIYYTIQDLFAKHLQKAQVNSQYTFTFNTSKIFNGSKVWKNLPEIDGAFSINIPAVNVKAMKGALAVSSDFFVSNPNSTLPPENQTYH